MSKLSFPARLGIILFSLGLAAVSTFAQPRHPDVASLSKDSREIFDISMKWGDQYWDPETKFLALPMSSYSASSSLAGLTSQSNPTAPASGRHFLVRDSTWYAMGLLLRDQSGDRDRAAQILRAVLQEQYREPGKPWDGTFRRTPEERPELGSNAVMWRAYDPNWREFIGTAFVVILNEYPDRIPPDLPPAMLESINYAVAGEIKQGRLLPTYTNIALMYGFLWHFAAVRGNRPDWVAPAIEWQETVYKLFKQYDAFFEYNSPTYAGTDLGALALEREYGFTPRMRAIGSEMEAGLWRAIADLYNANLRNVSGPYDRAYGMDMQSYVSVVGLYLRTVLDEDQAPLTKFDPPVDHVADLFFVPQIVILDTQIPPDAMKSFRSFQGEHQVRRQITDQRIATAWIGRTVIYGGEITGKTKDVGARSQFHPVTVQWQMPSGKIGWIMLTHCPPIDASADQKQIVISTSGDVEFRISAPGLSRRKVKVRRWTLPGLTVSVATDSKGFTVQQQGKFVDLKYAGITKMMLTIKNAAP
ncbi:MAG: hypothetical protein ABSF45_16390 [Terriglobia bacterium]|jgi:hypothetical protein